MLMSELTAARMQQMAGGSKCSPAEKYWAIFAQLRLHPKALRKTSLRKAFLRKISLRKHPTGKRPEALGNHLKALHRTELACQQVKIQTSMLGHTLDN